MLDLHPRLLDASFLAQASIPGRPLSDLLFPEGDSSEDSAFFSRPQVCVGLLMATDQLFLSD